ncbi:MAG: glycosyltransferase family 4 protein [Candidatus Aegiribacteria sp.]|nr:glycosyltransferase family 4 protein [Candidatus Aegiribacteria sp.]
MRILHLIHRTWPYHGGAERYVIEHALAGKRWGHESVICATDAWDMSWLVSRNGNHVKKKSDVWNGIEINRFPVLHPPFQNLLRAVLRRTASCGPDRYFYPNPFLPSLHRWLSKDRGFDFIHANAMPFTLYEGWYHSRKTGGGLAVVPHTSAGEKFRRVSALHYSSGCQKRIFLESNFVVAQSNFEKGLFTEIGVPSERIHFSGSGIEPEEFVRSNPAAALERLGVKTPIVLSLTAHCTDRGTNHIIEACRNLLKTGMKFTLVLAGPILEDTEDYLSSGSDFMDEFGENLVITGYIEKEKRIDLIAAADIVLLPSRLDCFGIVILEAWASGKPVIGCWTGGMPDMIEDGQNGFLVSWGDVATLTNRIDLLLKNPHLRDSMGDRGRKMVFSTRTWDAVTDRFYRRMAECSTEKSIN